MPVSCNWWISIHISSLFSVCCSFDIRTGHQVFFRFSMEAINFIRDECLALVDILQAQREQLLDVLENISSISLEDLGKVLEQYCAIRRDIILMVDRLDDMEEEFLSNQL